ncbi:hypothetical protein [Natrarchaeobaculum aegyptiacum]|uniref:Uncharacterized protein n=1 Tax=Natrarchaeobaculum aegyptiacum TaxID=745377 RepID=A0A2Z2HXL2_9EURY|nr:hypothetical protein [Natrarchaeobaculum aegyptiacum]ARS91872.1 hypothetical protein B1756_14675 [Natrarchaeobaculum aegyptiacum]
MTEVALLVAFCAVMGAVAIVKFALADERDPVDAGVILVVWGITVLAALWTALEEGWLVFEHHLLLAVVGIVLVGSGVAVMVVYWHHSPQSTPMRRRVAESGERAESTDHEANGDSPRQ